MYMCICIRDLHISDLLLNTVTDQRSNKKSGETMTQFFIFYI